MGSRLTLPSAGQTGGEAGVAPNSIFNVANGTSDLVLGDITTNTKFEVEYGFAVDTTDKIQIGRITVIYDGIEVICTSHEIESSGNLGVVSAISFDGFLDGNNIGLRFNNVTSEVVAFNYNIVNKFNVTYSPNPIVTIITENSGTRVAVYPYTDNTQQFGQTFRPDVNADITRIGVSFEKINLGNPTGNLTLSLYDGVNGNLIQESQPVDITTLPIAQQVQYFQFSIAESVLLTEDYYFEINVNNIVNFGSALRINLTGDDYVNGTTYFGRVLYDINRDIIFEVRAD